LVPNQPKSTIKSILASKSYGSCLDDMSYHTNRMSVCLMPVFYQNG